MSYRTRVYRHRNAQAKEEKPQPFFSNHDQNKNKQSGAFFQRKLAINKPGDQYEREADSVANAIMNPNDNKPIVQNKGISTIQRLSSSNEDEQFSTNDARMRKDKEVQRKPDMPMDKEKMKGMRKPDMPMDKEKMKAMSKPDMPMDKEKMKAMGKGEMPMDKEKDKMSMAQTKEEDGSKIAESDISSAIYDKVGKGKSIPEDTLKEMNRSFGLDFSEVTIHDDDTATQMSSELNAQAFTVGSDIFFNKGKFDPGTLTGKRLLAHELTHTVQQTGMPPANSSSSNIQRENEESENNAIPEKNDGNNKK